MSTQPLLVVATALQIVAVGYCAVLLRKHWTGARPWLALLGAMLSMLVWRVAVTFGLTPSPLFNTAIAISGSMCTVLAMFFFGREVGRRERAEAERDRLLQSERAARGDAERASRTKDDFLATLSHELRTPLTAILGWSTLLRNHPDRVDTDRALSTIERNAQMQARLVDDLLDATRMQAGSLHLELSRVSLKATVLAAIDMVRPVAEAKKVSLSFTCEDAEPTVLGDASRLAQVASNLLVNAVKFTPAGKAVTVSLATVGDHAELVVADEGIGIDPAFMPKLFERFRQAESGNARKYGGLGLGLSIASNLVEMHHGKILADSKGIGAGASFTVRLPLAAPAEPREDASAAKAPVDKEGFASIAGVRAIVVDDDADVRGAVVRLLEQAGATVLPLESGATIETALDEFRPDVLLLDISMPGEDGYTLIRRIRGLPAPEASTLPAISLTAHARDEDRDHALTSGFQAHLPKPVNLPVLIATMQRLARPAPVTTPARRQEEAAAV